MTVIASMISRIGTIHATDSLLTKARTDGTVESRRPKVVPVRPFRGALAYFGFAGRSRGLMTIDWLAQEVATAAECATPEEFSDRLARRLQAWLLTVGVATDHRFGIGVHFSAYERVADYWVPELFFVSNFLDSKYTSLRPDGVGYSRETYSTAKGVPRTREDRNPERRLELLTYLQEGGWLRFNNGDPLLFNPTADAIRVMIERAEERGVLAALDLPRLIRLTRMPVESVARTQHCFFQGARRVVGGRIHDLAITPNGEFSSTSGIAT